MKNPGRKSRALAVLAIASLSSAGVCGQSLSHRPPSGPDASPKSTLQSAAQPATPPRIDLIVPEGTALKVTLDRDIRVREVGQVVQGTVTESVYSFDKLVIPAGSEVSGKIAGLAEVTKTRRAMAALDADFSPARQVKIEFTELKFADGNRMPLHTVVSMGSQGVLQFVPAGTKQSSSAPTNLATRKMAEARQEMQAQWASLKKQMHESGKMHRLKRLALAQSPYRPQYMDAGASFNADLQAPLQFGSEALNPDMVSAIGDPPPSGSIVHALLQTPLSSATSKKGDSVDAVISHPLVVSNKLILPQGSHLQGTVLQVRPARRLGRNGQLRIVFHQIVPPDGIEQKIEASLEGVEVAKGEHLALDAEGGAQITAPRTRYLTTGIAVMLAASSMSPDRDAADPSRSAGEVGKGAAMGASGFKLVGLLAGTLSRSPAVHSSLGFYGAAVSIYSHFLARGRDVVYPKDMSMMVGLGTREAGNQGDPGKIKAHAANRTQRPNMPAPMAMVQ